MEYVTGVNFGFDECEISEMRRGPGKQHAVTVRHAFMEYKSVLKSIKSARAHVVLQDFNMTVEKGKIYALLGASGCGKTTLLRAIGGQLRLTSGEVRVMGHKPRTPGSGNPGTTVGYMPQDVSLLDEFTIMETFYYYGSIGGMSYEDIRSKADYLTKLLDLPTKSKITSHLSGGQQRRVSFAVALLHSPPVVILDEPTVGVDPVLRESVWKYMEQLAKENGATIIITTHYIEEATKADVVGLMRHGKLMAEQPPLALIESLNCTTLEDVLIKLCLLQSSKHSSSLIEAIPENTVLPIDDTEVRTVTSTWVPTKVSSRRKIYALAWKNILLLSRHYFFLFLLFSTPALVCAMFYFVVDLPTGMLVSVYNEESNCLTDGNFEKINSSGFCQSPSFLSCEILKILNEKGILTRITESEEAATENVQRGRSSAAVTFPKNFTSSLIERLQFTPFQKDIDDDIVYKGTVYFAMDQTDRIISTTIEVHIYDALKRVLAEYDDICHTIRHMRQLPMQFKTPVYGTSSPTFRDFACPGMMIAIVLFFPLMGTLCSSIPEKVGGTLERSLASGVTKYEVIIAHFLINLVVVIVQVISVMVINYGVFQIYMIGSYLLVFSLMLYIGFLGLLMGFVLASFSSSMTAAISYGLAMDYVFLMTSGMIWPMEGVPSPMKELCLMMPLLYNTEAIRHITQRGWTFYNKTPQLAALTTTCWSLAFVVLLIMVLRNQHR